MFLNLALLAFLVAAPFGPGVNVSLLAKFLSLAVLALSFDLMWGYGGILSFGHSAFFALGAYASALTLKHLSFPGVAFVSFATGTSPPWSWG